MTKETAQTNQRLETSGLAPEPEMIVRALLAEAEPAGSQPVQSSMTESQNEDDETTERGTGLLARVAGYRPTPSLLGWLIAALFLVALPGLVLGVALLLLATVAVAYFTLGHDRFAEQLSAFYSRLEMHSPNSAGRLREIHDRASHRLSRIVPEKLAFEMGLPDPDPAPMHPKLAQDPFERLARDAANADLHA